MSSNEELLEGMSETSRPRSGDDQSVHTPFGTVAKKKHIGWLLHEARVLYLELIGLVQFPQPV